MSETCPTVKIASDNEQGFVVINESDFDEALHELFDAPSQAADADAPKRRGRPSKSPHE